MSASTYDAHPYPIYGARFRLFLPILDNTGAPVSGALSPDTEISINSGTIADATNEVTQITSSSGGYYIDLTASEMTAKIVYGEVKTATADAKTTPFALYPRRLPVIRSATAQGSPTSTTVTLDSGASAVDGYYAGCYILLTNNTPSSALGQARKITAYTGSTKVATVEAPWGTSPNSSSTFDLLVCEESFFVLSDMRAIAGAAVATGTAQLGVNVVSYANGQAPLQPTTAGRTLDVSTGGEAGLDWANIGTPATTVNLSGTSTKSLQPTVPGRTLDVSTAGNAGIDWSNIDNPSTPQVLASTQMVTSGFSDLAAIFANDVYSVVTTMAQDDGTGSNKYQFTTKAVEKVWAVAARLLTAGTNIVLAKGVGLTGLNDIAATAIVSNGAITTSGGAVSTITTLTNFPADVTNMAARFLVMTELSGGYRYTTAALAQAPSGGGGGSTDLTPDQNTALRAILGVPITGTTPVTPSTGILAAIEAKVAALPAFPAAVSDIPSAAAIASAVNTVLTSAHGADSWQTGSGGGDGLSGPNSVSIVFKDAQGVVVPSVEFTVVGQGVGRADANGAAIFGLNTGNFVLVAGATFGTLFLPTMLTVPVLSPPKIITGTAIIVPPPFPPQPAPPGHGRRF